MKTVVRCAVGMTEVFQLDVGLHQGLALSPVCNSNGQVDRQQQARGLVNNDVCR